MTDLEHLRACYADLPADRAAGVDGVGKEEYGLTLETKLTELSAKLGRMGYRPQPVKRVYIQKPGTDKQRPLGILSFEDKLVQLALVRVWSRYTKRTSLRVRTAIGLTARNTKRWTS